MTLTSFASGLVDPGRLPVLHLLCLVFLGFQGTRCSVFWSRPSFTAMVFRRGEGAFSWLFSFCFLLYVFSFFF